MSLLGWELYFFVFNLCSEQGCNRDASQENFVSHPVAMQPVPSSIPDALKKFIMTEKAPIWLRVYKFTCAWFCPFGTNVSHSFGVSCQIKWTLWGSRKDFKLTILRKKNFDILFLWALWSRKSYFEKLYLLPQFFSEGILMIILYN